MDQDQNEGIYEPLDVQAQWGVGSDRPRALHCARRRAAPACAGGFALRPMTHRRSLGVTSCGVEGKTSATRTTTWSSPSGRPRFSGIRIQPVHVIGRTDEDSGSAPNALAYSCWTSIGSRNSTPLLSLGGRLRRNYP